MVGLSRTLQSSNCGKRAAKSVTIFRRCSPATFEGFRWETPALANHTAEHPFEFVLVNTSEFASGRSDRNTYLAYFTDTDVDDGVVSFPDIEKNAMLVVPAPRDKDVSEQDASYGHLDAFVGGTPKSEARSL